MWTDCITSIRHVLKLNGYGGPQAKANEKRQRFKGWETLGTNMLHLSFIGVCVGGQITLTINAKTCFCLMD